MPKRKNRNKKRKGRNNSLTQQNSISRMTGRSYSTLTYSTASDTTTIAEANLVVTNLGDRAAAFGDMFMYWRMTRLRIHAFVKTGRYVLTTSTANAQSLAEAHSFALAFVPISNADYTIPTTMAQVVDFPEFKLGSGRFPLTLQVGRKGLTGSILSKWLLTGTTADSVLQSAGTATTVLVSPIGDTAANASYVQIVYDFDLEFKTPTDTATLPSLLIDKKVPRKATNFAWTRMSEKAAVRESFDFETLDELKVHQLK